MNFSAKPALFQYFFVEILLLPWLIGLFWFSLLTFSVRRSHEFVSCGFGAPGRAW